jgi:hypothetical protein
MKEYAHLSITFYSSDSVILLQSADEPPTSRTTINAQAVQAEKIMAYKSSKYTRIEIPIYRS